MAAPNIKLYVNIGSDPSPNWSEVGASQQIVYCGSGGTTNMTTPPSKSVPTGSSCELYSEMWKGSSGSYTKVANWFDDMTLNGMQNVLKFTWDAAFAAAPVITVYDNSSRVSTSQMLAGTAGDTNSTSYIKGVLTDASITASWCSATTGASGAVSTLDQGQALKGTDYYLDLTNATWNGASNQTLNLAPWIGANYTPTGVKTVLLTLKYEWS